MHQATLRLEATVEVPDGYGAHRERRVVYACPEEALRWLTRADELWGWEALAPAVTHWPHGCGDCSCEHDGSL